MESEFKALSLLLPPANEDDRVDAGLRAFAALRTRVAELEAENAALASIAEEHVNTAHRYRDALEQYAKHHWDCPMFNPTGADRVAQVECDCSARPALEALNLPTHA